MIKNRSSRKMLVTMALTYANGEIHLGHLLEAIQADIWVRFQRSIGNECHFIGGSDAHGTAVMLAAEKAGLPAAQYAHQVMQDHMNDYTSFLIGFDAFQSTDSPENEALVNQIYHRLQDKGNITQHSIQHAYDPQKKIFLADRFIRGDCPKCGANDQYGDNCEVCSSTYDVTQLKNPKSVYTGATPVLKESVHYFFNIAHYHDMLHDWIHRDQHVSVSIANKLEEWFKEGLREWDITRDGPYFGFKIPQTHNKYFYVWLDAPVGYMSIFQHLCQQQPSVTFADFWDKESQAELHHFIGKDIVYFHALFWPAMLAGSGYRLPTSIKTHGYLTINGSKMSKSRGTFITAKQFLAQYDAEFLRYYFAAKLSSQTEDVDLNLQDFAQRVNSDLVGKYVNLASRCAGFIHKKFDGQLATSLHEPELYQQFVAAGSTIAEHFEQGNFNRAVRDIMALADRANQYIDQHKPWQLAKQDSQLSKVQAVCTQGLNLFRVLSIYLQPILPRTALKVQEFLNCAPLTWAYRDEPLLDHTIRPFTPLITRIALDNSALDIS